MEVQMYNKTQVYELSFVSTNRRRRTNPRFELVTKADFLPVMIERLASLLRRWREPDNTEIQDSEFTLPVSDLFDKREFGYDRCGEVRLEDGMAAFSIELSARNRLACAYTMQMLTFAFLMSDDSPTPSNRTQQVDIEMRCDPDLSSGYGHATSGYLSGEVRTWMRDQCVSANQADVPKEVVRAMRDAWRALADTPENKAAASQCDGGVTKDGRFILVCPGDACDLAIYPDQVWEGMSVAESVRFSCHNLDTSQQQLTLLAGLAKICELARANRETGADP